MEKIREWGREGEVVIEDRKGEEREGKGRVRDEGWERQIMWCY